MENTHIFVGPTLSHQEARTLLPKACLHPPIQCGDILRLLRLNPKKIIIIDGLYELVPAVWHKEILLALQLGIEVWGSASMGALRAAELYRYGMKGYGVIFENYRMGELIDDDEVAVLHRGIEDSFASINDAMVNIRATCEQAVKANLLSVSDKDKIVTYAKAQFYPYRSLKNIVSTLSATLTNAQPFLEWVEAHGVVDVKKQDAIAVLTLQQQEPADVDSSSVPTTPYTIFLSELSQFANLKPFPFTAKWLPDIERELQDLAKKNPIRYTLLAEIAFFLRKLLAYAKKDTQAIDNKALTQFIAAQALASPARFHFFENHDHLAAIYSLICQSICLGSVKENTIKQYLPAISHYYDLSAAEIEENKPILESLLVVLFSIQTQVGKPNSHISEKTLSDHLNKLFKRRHYTAKQFEAWFNPQQVDRQVFMNFLLIYLKIARSYLQESPQTQNYFKWIHDVYYWSQQFFTGNLKDKLQNSHEEVKV